MNSSSTLPLRERLEALSSDVQPLLLRGVVRHIFTDLARLMDYLSVADASVERGDHLREAVKTYSLIRAEARSLLDYIEMRGMRAAAFYHALHDALDGISFAISHELRRVYEQELAEVEKGLEDRLTVGRMGRANGLLQNCFQQSIVILAQVFHPLVSGPSLFDNLESKREESLQLSEELGKLVRFAHRTEREAKLTSAAKLIEQLGSFRHTTMHYLMYRDWDSFEQLFEELVAASSKDEMRDVVHRLASYLDALHSHVRMRAVLSTQEAAEYEEPVSSI
ncbi:MAG: hypothetical protein WBP93_03315 [Pyrinomonadaceae bacterium]